MCCSSPRNLTVDAPGHAAWDAFVAATSGAHLLQQTAWGDLKASTGWAVQQVAVTTPESNNIHAGAQILLRRRYGVSAAYVPRGPIFAPTDPFDADIAAELLRGMERLARRNRAVFLRLEPNVREDESPGPVLHRWLIDHGFRPADPIQPRSTIQLDLRPDLDTLMAHFSKGHRADIRRAAKQGVTVQVGTEADIPAFYSLMQDTGARAGFGIHSAEYYRLAWQLFQPRSRLLLAIKDGDVVAGHLVLADHWRGCYLYSGATGAGLKAGANHLLEWHALQWARELGCTHYDFWGIPDALGQAAATDDPPQREALEAAAQDDPLIGVYRFKKGFGGQVVRFLPAYDKVYIPPLYRFWRRRYVG